MKKKDKILYFCIRSSTYFFRFLPYSWIHRIGKFFGNLAYHFLAKFRKRALSNLSMAKSLQLSEKQLHKIAKQSFQNLAINCLEYVKFAYEKDFSKVIQCENSQVADKLFSQGQGIILFCGHQSNWEVLSLDGNLHMRGIAIGKPIKNPYLYKWIVSIREKTGGKIITPKNALKHGLKSLKKGLCLGIVGDQGMPTGKFSHLFLGRQAWSSTAVGLLSYKTNSPIVVAIPHRHIGKYTIRYSDPIWPNLLEPMEKEIKRLTNKSLEIFEKSVQKAPGQWLWQHNRWKQQTPKVVYKEFRHDCICIILPRKPQEIFSHLTTFREIYPSEYIAMISPKGISTDKLSFADEIIPYEKNSEIFLRDYRFKIVFNFTDIKRIKKHFLRLSAFRVLNLKDLKKLASPYVKPGEDLSFTLKKALCRPKTLWN